MIHEVELKWVGRSMVATCSCGAWEVDLEGRKQAENWERWHTRDALQARLGLVKTPRMTTWVKMCRKQAQSPALSFEQRQMWAAEANACEDRLRTNDPEQLALFEEE